MSAFEWETIYSQYCKITKRIPHPFLSHQTGKKLAVPLDALEEDDLPPLLKALEDTRTILFEIRLHSKEFHNQERAFFENESLSARAGSIDVVLQFDEYFKHFFSALAHFMSHSTSLSRLIIRGLHLPIDVLERIVEDVVLSPSIRILRLEDCPLNNEAVTTICTAFHDSLNFQHLSLIRCSLKSDCASEIVKMIKAQEKTHKLYFKRYHYLNNSSKKCGLKTLNLDDNPDFGDSGIETLLEGVRFCDNLERISLRYCGWTDLTEILLDNITNSFKESKMKVNVILGKPDHIYEEKFSEKMAQKKIHWGTIETESSISKEKDNSIEKIATTTTPESQIKDTSEISQSSTKELKTSSKKIRIKKRIPKKYAHIKAKIPTRDIIPRFRGFISQKKKEEEEYETQNESEKDEKEKEGKSPNANL